MQLTINSVTHYAEKKDGTPLVDKRGKPYQRAVIKTKETGTDFLSGFVYQPLKEGQVIEAEVKEEEYNGKMSKKFHIVSKDKQEAEKTERALVYLSRNVDASLATGQMILGEIKTLIKRLETKGILDSDINKGSRPLVRADDPMVSQQEDEFPPLELYES